MFHTIDVMTNPSDITTQIRTIRRKKGKEERMDVTPLFYAFMQKCTSAVERLGLDTVVREGDWIDGKISSFNGS